LLSADLAAIEPFLHQYGALTVFTSVLLEKIGGPTPSETLIIIAALLVSSESFGVGQVILAGWLGGVLGGVITYVLGRYGGLPALKRHGHRLRLSPATIERTQRRLRGNGMKLVFAAQFLPFLRQVKGVAAGAADMSWLSYMTANVIGCGLWALAWGGGSYILGQRILGLRELVHEYALVILLVPFLLAFAAAAGFYWRNRRGATPAE
jgi:membrane protein DedA with SNARE-associated domain